jgi:glyoxylase-like metal-dependent hydrolase (beta-lactamase superfamily II)
MALSRRDFLATSALATIAGTLGRAELARAWQQAGGRAGGQAQPVFTAIRRNVGFFTMQGGTIGYLLDPNAVIVVDSQFPAPAKACLDGLNERSKGRAIDALVNTHHHGDHTAGNIAFKGAAKKIVAHAQAAEHMKQPPGQQAPTTEQLYPDTTFTDRWQIDAGGERIHARHYGRAHTSGDAVITFERANVAHMGDLMFNQRHPVVDRAAGASIRNWMAVLDRVPKDHAADTIYIFGHANTGLPVTGDRSELARFRDYLGALLGFVEAQIKAGRSRDEILAMRDPLKGFESFGRFGNPNARDPLTVAYEELTGKQ